MVLTVESIEVTYSSIAEVWQATVWLDGGLHESRHNGATAGAGAGAAGAAAAGAGAGAGAEAAGAGAGLAAAGAAAAGLGKVSRTLRSTGDSIVEDGDLTYSPRALRCAIRDLLSVPSSLASALTRTFATFLLSSVRAATGEDRVTAAGTCSLLSAHRVLISV